MKIKLLLFFCLFTIVAFAQKETNIWYFGEHAGLDFNSGTPVALTDGKLETSGCEKTPFFTKLKQNLSLYNCIEPR